MARTSLTLYHLKMDAPVDVRRDIACPGSERLTHVVKSFEKGLYEKVATAVTEQEGDEALEWLWRVTQNGVVSESWSREPPAGVVPEGDGCVRIGERVFGRKSSDVGDVILTEDGKRYFVDSIGFTAF